MKTDIMVCWDLDKTLTDVSGVTDTILQTVLNNHGIDYYKNILPKFRDPKIEWKPIEYRLKQIFWEEKWQQYFQEFRNLKEKNDVFPPLFDGIKDVLEQNQQMVHAVVTNKESSMAFPEIRENGIEWNFKIITTSDDTLWDTSKLKPSSFLIEHTIQWFSPEILIMIWDTAADINALLQTPYSNKKAVLAWWGNNKQTLHQQIELIWWKAWIDYDILDKTQDVSEYLNSL